MIGLGASHQTGLRGHPGLRALAESLASTPTGRRLSSAPLAAALQRAALPDVLRELSSSSSGLASTISDVDPDALVLQAGEHGLSALLLHELSRAGVALPGSSAQQLRRDAMNTAASVLRVRMLLLRAIDALAKVDIIPVLLKGPALAERLYPEPLLRPTTDVDLLVAPDEVDRASAAIEKMGFRRFVDPGEDDVFGHHHHLSFTSDAGIIELHFRLTSGFGTESGREAIAPRTREALFERRTVRFLAPEEELVYLAIHAAQHLFLRISWLYDLKLLVKASAVDWDRVVALVNGSGMRGAAFAAFQVAQDVVGFEIPADVLRRIRPSRVHARLLRMAFSEASVAHGWIARQPQVAAVLRTLLSEGPVQIGRGLAEGVVRNLKRAVRRGGARAANAKR